MRSSSAGARASEREIAWAAGLFEGEGSIHCNQINGRKYLLLNLSSNDHDVVERFAAAIGCGKVYGPYLDKNAKNPRWSWHAKNKADAAHAVDLLEPFLCSRRMAKLQEVRGLVANQRPIITASEKMLKVWARRRAGLLPMPAKP